LKDGTCADQGYTVQTGSRTISVPVIGDITVTEYSKGMEVSASDSCSLYEIADGTCGQSDLDCNYVGPAKAFRSTLKDGTCADQGYTVQGQQDHQCPGHWRHHRDRVQQRHGCGLRVLRVFLVAEGVSGQCGRLPQATEAHN